MSHLVNLSDEVYNALTELKKIRNASYSEIINELLHRTRQIARTTSWQDMISKAKERDTKFKGKKEKIDYDLIAYGVSRDSS